MKVTLKKKTINQPSEYVSRHEPSILGKGARFAKKEESFDILFFMSSRIVIDKFETPAFQARFFHGFFKEKFDFFQLFRKPLH